MSDSLEQEYVTEPVHITDTVALAPSMKGGLALVVDGEHIDHFEREELAQIYEQVDVALTALEGYERA